MFDTLVWHYTATYDDQDIGALEIDVMHKARGWSEIGYHAVVRLNGARENGRSVFKMGAHIGGQNFGKLGYVTVGGLKHATGPNVGHDTRNREQIATQIEMTRETLNRWPTIKRIVGHRDLASTQCPGYDVAAWWASVNGQTVAPKPPAPDAPAVTYALTKRGSRGHAVRALQDALNIAGFDAGPVDGIFGARTDAAVRAFQMHAGLSVDGMVGPNTWAALL